MATRINTATTTTTTINIGTRPALWAYVRPEEDARNSEEDISTANDNTASSSSDKFQPTQQLKSASSSSSSSPKSKGITPKIGDLVRYYELDGGNPKGQECVGKISFITTTIQKKTDRSSSRSEPSSDYIAELTPLEDLGDGYFAEFSASKRRRSIDRDIRTQISPLTASYVRSEQAFKVPYNTTQNKVRVRQEQYDLEDWDGPTSNMPPINTDVVEADGILYSQIKQKLFKNTAIAGLLGSAVVNLWKGPEDGAIYFAGALASLSYLFFLSLKTDTMAGSMTSAPSGGSKLGSKISNLRFGMPVLLVLGVAIYNQSLGDANPLASSENPLDQLTTEQFGAAILGFLTYRVPLFLGQLQDALASQEGKESAAAMIPGSAGMALKLATSSKKTTDGTTGSTINVRGTVTADDDLIPVLLVSGPQATGRDELVKALLDQDDRLVPPVYVDKMSDGVTFERLASRGEFVLIDETQRYGLSKDGILQAATTATAAAAAATTESPAEATLTSTDSSSSSDSPIEDIAPVSASSKVVVVNADVGLAKKLAASLSGARLIGVWVGLDSVQEFERRLELQMDQGILQIEEEGDRETTLRTKMKEIIQEIDFGLSSGIFEFTILSKDPETSLKELKQATQYCFK